MRLPAWAGKTFCFSAVFLISGCMARNPATKAMVPDAPGSEAGVLLRHLSYHDGVLEGELLNQSQRTAQVVVLEISFLDPRGMPVFTQDFKAVPGGDGRALLPRQAKHFSYGLRLAQSEKVSIVGRIKTIE
ncbi:MAG: hypothetical protein HZB91_07025 [Elusimicrobia bacterium]|nr:hypothetical protein [Elusimicrobiota bacterium]